jgi:hypothetical protein
MVTTIVIHTYIKEYKMRLTKKFAHPVELLGVRVDSVAYGQDRALGFFVQGFKGGRCVLDRDGWGMGVVDCPNGPEPLGQSEYAEAEATIRGQAYWEPFWKRAMDCVMRLF